MYDDFDPYVYDDYNDRDYYDDSYMDPEPEDIWPDEWLYYDASDEEYGERFEVWQGVHKIKVVGKKEADFYESKGFTVYPI